MKPSGKSGGKPDNKITGLCIEQRPVCLWSGGSSPRRDAPEAPVGKVAVPKTVQKPPSPRRDASGAPVGKVSVPKTSQKSPFATRGCLWIICGPTLRADGYAEHPIRTSMSIKQPDSMDTHPFRTSISMKTANFMDTHPLRTSTSMKKPDSMDTHPIHTSTDR